MHLAWAKLIIKLALLAICSVGGYLIAAQIESFAAYWWVPWLGLLAGFCFALLALFIERLFKRIPLKVILGGTIGLLVGLSIAKLIGYGFTEVQNTTVRVAVYVVLSCLFGYVGMVLGGIKIAELGWPNLPWVGRGGGRSNAPKVLNTSVIIDGRIADIAEAGFLEGVLLVPEFVLQELQHIADSADSTRRVRGRRGLDILKRLQQEQLAEVKIDREDFDNISEVDAKLVALALRRNAKIVTNDFNLAKVAEVQGIRVLNINRLANALKPVVLPGEVLRLQILKPGKEQGQGIAYLDDGTMVVVENAGKLLGHEVEVAVTSVLQTTAGRMIFTTLKNVEPESRH